ncbi:MAG: hypothetical protein ACREQ5_10410, partial [Candidatus Dormibacteria bacterium]
MATNNWTGNAETVPQVGTYTPANVATGNTYTLTTNGKTLTYTALAADTVALVCQGLLNILNGQDKTQIVPSEFGFLTFSGVGTSGSFTAIQAIGESDGRPFTLASSASGGTATFTAATTQAAISPSDVGLAANWSAGVPTTGQDLVIAGANVPNLLYNLTALLAVSPNSVTITANVQIGLPPVRKTRNQEYLPQSLQLASVTTGNLTINNTSSLMRFDFLAGTVVANIEGTGRPSVTGMGAANFINGPTTLYASGGITYVAPLGGDAATISGNIRLQSGATVVLGAGTTILGTININSGATLTTNSNVGTIAVNGGMWNHAAGTVASPSLQGNG